MSKDKEKKDTELPEEDKSEAKEANAQTDFGLGSEEEDVQTGFGFDEEEDVQTGFGFDEEGEEETVDFKDDGNMPSYLKELVEKIDADELELESAETRAVRLQENMLQTRQFPIFEMSEAFLTENRGLILPKEMNDAIKDIGISASGEMQRYVLSTIALKADHEIPTRSDHKKRLTILTETPPVSDTSKVDTVFGAEKETEPNVETVTEQQTLNGKITTFNIQANAFFDNIGFEPEPVSTAPDKLTRTLEDNLYNLQQCQNYQNRQRWTEKGSLEETVADIYENAVFRDLMAHALPGELLGDFEGKGKLGQLRRYLLDEKGFSPEELAVAEKDIHKKFFDSPANVSMMLTGLKDYYKAKVDKSEDVEHKQLLEKAAGKEEEFFGTHRNVLRGVVSREIAGSVSGMTFPVSEASAPNYYKEQEAEDARYKTALLNRLKPYKHEDLLTLYYTHHEVGSRTNEKSQEALEQIKGDYKILAREHELKSAFIRSRDGAPPLPGEKALVKTLAEDLKGFQRLTKQDMYAIADTVNGKEVDFSECSKGLEEATKDTLAPFKRVHSAAKNFNESIAAADNDFDSKRSGVRGFFRRRSKLEEARNTECQRQFGHLHNTLDSIFHDTTTTANANPSNLAALAGCMDTVAGSLYTANSGNLNENQKEVYGKDITNHYQDKLGEYQYRKAANLLEGAKERLKAKHPGVEQLTLRDVRKTVEARMEKEGLSGGWEQHIALNDIRDTLATKTNISKEAEPRKVSYDQAAELLKRTKQIPVYQEDKNVQNLTMLDVRSTVKERREKEGQRGDWQEDISLNDIKQVLRDKGIKDVTKEKGEERQVSQVEKVNQRRESKGKEKEVPSGKGGRSG